MEKTQKIQSETTGFENIGKFYEYIINYSKHKLKPIDRDIYMLIAKYSFGYMNNIQYEIQISTKYISEKLNVSTGSVSLSLKKLQCYGLINRIKWQNIGPKQTYKYMIVMPSKFNIKHKTEEKKDITVENKDTEINNISDLL